MEALQPNIRGWYDRTTRTIPGQPMNVLDRFRLDGKRLFITGGSRGFGRVIALAAAEAGARILLNAPHPPTPSGNAHEGRGRGRKGGAFAADIAQPPACEGAFHPVLA